MELTATRLCLDCNGQLHGRTDKKFCDDQCRSSYNNKIRAANNGCIKSVNLILKRNRDLLEKFNPNGRAKVSSLKLIAAGFDLRYHTHTYQSPKGDLYIFCYEQGYLELNSNEFLLLKKTLK